MRRLLLALVAISLPMVAVSPALAHTAVRVTSIADNATLPAAPTNFTVTFSAATGLANVTLINTAGAKSHSITHRPARWRPHSRSRCQL